ncbi:sulfite exporter TauE/SafE family protein [Marinicella rhabdoformis]|uniref:sulfite exporter TauE/SafE family protein n=1 Tax=Marinicella rhabdoformis TaxID=2580566 RepID=UPI0012AEB719|nr:sulfite exporter TauE/SafE family protein [Marinicella rhabdoformis]
MWVLTPFVIGLFSGFHCIVMCGGLCSVICQKNTPKNLTMTHFGRICTYSLLGLLFAGVIQGASLQLDGALFTLVLRTLMGVALLLTGLALWLKSTAMAIKFEIPLWHKASQKLSYLNQQQTAKVQWYKGLLWGLLPCGLLYGMLLVAATTGSAWQGGLFMFTFGLGTVMPLLISQNALKRWQNKGQSVAAIFIFTIGLWTIISPWVAHRLIPQDSPWLLSLSLVLERCIP